MMDYPEELVALCGVTGPLPLADVLYAAKKANRIGPLQVLRYDRVVGPDHVRTAALHAQRAFDEGRNQADRIEVEFVRYVAGERQIKRALAKMGIEDGADGAVVVSLGEKRLDALRYFVDYLGLREDNTLVEPTLEKLEAFGIPRDALAATTDDNRDDTVMEAVAAVDLMRS